MTFNAAHEMADFYAGEAPALAGEASQGPLLARSLGAMALPRYYSSASEGAGIQAFGAEDWSGHEPPSLQDTIAAATSAQPPHLAVKKTVEQLAADARREHGQAELTPAGQRDAAQDRRDVRDVQSGTQRAQASSS